MDIFQGRFNSSAFHYISGGCYFTGILELLTMRYQAWLTFPHFILLVCMIIFLFTVESFEREGWIDKQMARFPLFFRWAVYIIFTWAVFLSAVFGLSRNLFISSSSKMGY
jgi:hypothetical protein